jgi:ACR3 family arsenite transporter
MGFFERYLTIWVLACIALGILLGGITPQTFESLAAMEYARINLPVGLLIWVMIIPMLVRIDLRAVRDVTRHARGIGITLFVNWLVKPFSMALLAVLFLQHLFVDLLPADEIEQYIAGLIILAAAPCTAMVFVWSRLTRGDPVFTLSQVALNDAIMVVAFAPIVALLLGISSITVPWETLLASVVLYIGAPLLIAQWIRRRLLRAGPATMARFEGAAGTASIVALLAMLVLLFGLQGQAVLQQPLIIALLAVPILIQVFFTSSLAYGLNRLAREPHQVAGPSALIGASNFFELAVAVAISLFGIQSGAALATVVGVLVEVPFMLVVVHAVNRSKDWYERGLAPR